LVATSVVVETGHYVAANPQSNQLVVVGTGRNVVRASGAKGRRASERLIDVKNDS
jgi:hypothetical protein